MNLNLFLPSCFDSILLRPSQVGFAITEAHHYSVGVPYFKPWNEEVFHEEGRKSSWLVLRAVFFRTRNQELRTKNSTYGAK